MKKPLFVFLILVVISSISLAQVGSLEPFPLTDAWKQKIRNLAPEKTTVPVAKKHKVLLFSLFTGFEHWVIPHGDAVIEILGDKTGAYDVVQSNDIFMFEKDKLYEFDAIILNNNCSKGDHRNLFYDELLKNKNMTDEERFAKADELEKNLLEYVKNGGGLFAFHGAIVMQNNSAEFSEMLGGSFDYHPPQQKIELNMVDKNHPLTKAFGDKPFVHIDEPYMFKNAYHKKHFRPLLYMEFDKIQKMKHQPEDKVGYVSWIKRYGKGRVFYVSPSHNAQSYEDARLLQFYLDGLQYVLGDLQCDDTPIKAQ